MADQEHLEILNQGVETWNRWRIDNPEIQPDLSEAHLEGTNLSRANLSEARLEGAFLGDANLSGAHLRGAVLVGAHIQEAILDDADLNDADLTNASLRKANLSGARLFKADFSGTHLEGADLRGADLSDVVHLTWRQILDADIGEETKLPTAITERHQDEIKTLIERSKKKIEDRGK